MGRSRWLSVTNAVMFVVFVSWAMFQYNDPDFFIWTLVYSIAALCCLLYYLKRLSPAFGAVVAIGALAWSAVLGYFVLTAEESFSFLDDNIGETAREALGLLIIALWTGFIARRSALEKPRRREVSLTNE